MSLEDRIQWFENRSEKHPVLVKEIDSNVTAWASLSPWTNYGAYARTVEISIFIAPEARGKGIGKEMIATILDMGQNLNHRVFLARIIEGNEASVRLFKFFGFEQVSRMPDAGEKFGEKITPIILQKKLLLRYLFQNLILFFILLRYKIFIFFILS
ncbi:MAG: GNAT family N-acetyltransferase [Microscillaceae bacterium]|nr:GNAT family N-acetyltransferase [Microscillaceae bacterium]